MIRSRTSSLRPSPVVSAVLYGALALGATLMLLPFVWMILASLMSAKEIMTRPLVWLPAALRFENYATLRDVIPLGRVYLNSAVVATATTLGILLTSSLAGYGFAKFRFPGRDLLFLFVLATLMIPFFVVLIPIFYMISKFGWIDSYPGLIVPNIATAFGIFLMRQYIVQAVPDELIDAGRVDGAGEFRVFWTLVLPLVRPALGALAIWNFLGVYNSFLWPLVVMSSNEKLMLPVGLAQVYGNYSREYGLVMGGAVLAAVPMIVVFVALRRQFIEGLTFGALKG